MLAVDTHKLEGIVTVSLNTKAAGLVDQGAPSARRARGSLNNYARISRFSSLLFAAILGAPLAGCAFLANWRWPCPCNARR